MSKLLSPADIQYSQNQVNSNITIDSSSVELSIVQYEQGSDGEVQTAAYYNSLNHLFYKSHFYGGNCTSTNKGTLYSYTQEASIPQHKNKFNTTGVLYSISGSVYGEKIRPGSFSLTASDGGTDIAIKDDGYGNLYPTNTTGNFIISSSGATSVSSSNNYVGNIFYEHGLAILTETGSFKSGKSYSHLTGSVSMSFDTTTTINTMEIKCVLEAHEYNTTSNPTVLYSGSIETSKFNDSRAYENPLSTGGQNQEYNTMEQLNVGLPSYHQSGSIRNITDYTIKPLFRTNEFKTYITKIGIYNNENELIMIAGLPSPIQKLMNQKMTFKIQIDL